MPTIFSVPNPPQQLSTARRPPKRRATETVTSPSFAELSPSAGDVTSAETLMSPSSFATPRSDHTYSVSRQNTHIESCSEADAVLQATPRRVRSTFAPHRITTENDKRLRTIIRRQRVTICRLRQKVALLRSSNQQPKLGMFANLDMDSQANKQLSTFFVRQLRLSTCKKFGRRFSAIDKNFALSLFFLGPRPIHFVNVCLFCLRNVRYRCG